MMIFFALYNEERKKTLVEKHEKQRKTKHFDCNSQTIEKQG